MKRISLLLLLLLAACGGAPTEAPTAVPPTVAPTEVPPTAVPPTEVVETEAVAEPEAAVETEVVEEAAAEPEVAPEIGAPVVAAVADLPGWANLELTDARTGETFTLADFSGETVYVHMMATWCTNCRSSQQSLGANVLPAVEGEDIRFVSIDVQTQITGDQLARYANDNGFNWTFSVASNEMITALTEEFGRTVTSPPSTPYFVIYPDGSISTLQTGRASTDEKLALLRGEV